MATYGTLTTNTDTVEIKVTGPAHVHCSGTFGAGTITWKFVGRDGNYKDIANGAFTSAEDKTFNWADGTTRTIKGTLAGSTGASLYYEVNGADVREVV